MTVQITISVEGAQRGLRAALASLPESYRIVSDARDADVVVVDGGTPWATRTRALLAAGRTTVLIVDPDRFDADLIGELRQIAASAGSAVEVIRGWASDPAVEPFSDAVRDAVSPIMADSTMICDASGDVDRAQREHLDLVAAALGAPLEILDDQRVEGSRVVTAQAARDGASLLVVCCTVAMPGVEAEATVRLLTESGRLLLRLRSPDSARPAQSLIGDADGEVIAPYVYESAYRAVLRRLRASIPAGT